MSARRHSGYAALFQRVRPRHPPWLAGGTRLGGALRLLRRGIRRCIRACAGRLRAARQRRVLCSAASRARLRRRSAAAAARHVGGDATRQLRCFARQARAVCGAKSAVVAPKVHVSCARTCGRKAAVATHRASSCRRAMTALSTRCTCVCGDTGGARRARRREARSGRARSRWALWRAANGGEGRTWRTAQPGCAARTAASSAPTSSVSLRGAGGAASGVSPSRNERREHFVF